MKPLTIEELKSLKVGDWVWIIDIERDERFYVRKDEECEIRVVGDNIDDEFAYTTADEFGAFPYSDYSTKWLAYKNKEQAEAKGEIVELPRLGDKCCRFYRQSTGNIFAIEGKVIKIEINKKGTLIYFTNLPNFYFDKVFVGDLSKEYIDLESWYFCDKSEAERRLAELKGEKEN